MAKKRTKKNGNGRDPVGQASGHKDVCFVIMPFGGWLGDYYELIYRPAIEAAGLVPHRADDLYRPSTIVTDIWAYTKQAKLLIADLTGKNPNVFYELGLAHALAKPVILVAESMEDIPFDLRALRVIVYDKNDPSWGEQLRAKIEVAIGEVLSAPQEAVLPAFLHVRESSGVPKVTPREKDIIEIKQELDLLRREVRRRTPDVDTGVLNFKVFDSSYLNEHAFDDGFLLRLRDRLRKDRSSLKITPHDVVRSPNTGEAATTAAKPDGSPAAAPSHPRTPPE